MSKRTIDEVYEVAVESQAKAIKLDREVEWCGIGVDALNVLFSYLDTQDMLALLTTSKLMHEFAYEHLIKRANSCTLRTCIKFGQWTFLTKILPRIKLDADGLDKISEIVLMMGEAQSNCQRTIDLIDLCAPDVIQAIRAKANACKCTFDIRLVEYYSLDLSARKLITSITKMSRFLPNNFYAQRIAKLTDLELMMLYDDLSTHTLNGFYVEYGLFKTLIQQHFEEHISEAVNQVNVSHVRKLLELRKAESILVDISKLDYTCNHTVPSFWTIMDMMSDAGLLSTNIKDIKRLIEHKSMHVLVVAQYNIDLLMDIPTTACLGLLTGYGYLPMVERLLKKLITHPKFEAGSTDEKNTVFKRAIDHNLVKILMFNSEYATHIRDMLFFN